MIIYAVMYCDRHLDPTVFLFSKESKAISFAEKISANFYTNEMAEVDDNSMDEVSLKNAGWLYYKTLSKEGDCIWVLSVELDAMCLTVKV